MMSNKAMHTPLAERMRPQHYKDVIGQQHLLGPGKPLARLLESQQMQSLIFWGPPGVGKTTLARIIAQHIDLPFFNLSAIDSGVKEVRNVIAQASENGKAILFVDEIHRFSKSQQDSLLGAVEKGTIILIGATTENPSFEVINALLSRSNVYILEALNKEDLLTILHKAVQEDEVLSQYKIVLKETEALLALSGGDARKLLNILELLVQVNNVQSEIVITNEATEQVVNTKMALYDKQGEMHYDVISAFIKCIRGSDPNAAVYWLARMIHAGEDAKFIARRMVILAAEDIGLANPNALLMANTCFDAVHKIGFPESRIILSECAIYLACSAKSNSAYVAIDDALALVRNAKDLAVPLHLRNAPTALMKELNYGKDYQYAHQFTGNFINQEFLPDEISGKIFYQPGSNAMEDKTKEYLARLWPKYYGK
jgi:putative ATPase